MADGIGKAAAEAAAEKRREKAKNLRYRRAVAADMNIWKIREELSEIGEACAEVQWFVDSPDGRDTLLSAMDGDEDEAFEFRMAFSSLSSDVERMQEALSGGWHSAAVEDEDFDGFFAAIRASVDGRGSMWGYDEYEQDYFGLDDWSAELGVREARKRLMRLTKAEIIDLAQRCFNVAVQFVGLRSRYDDMKAALDILRGQNAGYLQQIREIEEEYEEAMKDEYPRENHGARFDGMLAALPDRAWIE